MTATDRQAAFVICVCVCVCMYIYIYIYVCVCVSSVTELMDFRVFVSKTQNQ